MNDRDEWPEPAAVAVMRRRAEKAEAEVLRLQAEAVAVQASIERTLPPALAAEARLRSALQAIAKRKCPVPDCEYCSAEAADALRAGE